MKYSDIPSAQIAVQTARKMGIDRVVISPGSRNAPLILSFTNDAYFNCYSLVDERSAAFFALGMARETGGPVILVCTSGSALLNYYPAVAEAYYSRIPLIVLSADRPPYKIDIGDGQTIRQPGVFQTHCECNLQLQLDVLHATQEQFTARGVQVPEEAELLRRQAEIQAKNLEQLIAGFGHAWDARGPVHINIPFEEPLYGLTEEWKDHEVNWQPPAFPDPPAERLEEFKAAWKQAGRKMVLIGVADPGTIPADLLEALAGDPSVIVFTETTSNIADPAFFPSIDSIIAPLEKSKDSELLFKYLQPDIIITFGGLVVSKKVKAFLRKFPASTHWHLGPGPSRATFYMETWHIESYAVEILGKPSDQPEQLNRGYRSLWNGVKEQYKKLRKQYLEQIPHSDFSAFAEILKHIPETYKVHFSNSSPIRYAQLFDMKPGVQVFCNRGTSGIEGCTSTAIGAAAANQAPTLLVTGDLGFLYDSNAFWNAYIPGTFRIIVINNAGGGIFRILPGKEESEIFERYFETTHTRSCKTICETYGLAYQSVASAPELRSVWDDFYAGDDQPKLLEIITPRKVNDRILLDYFDFLSSKTTYNPILIETPDGEQKR